MLLPSDDLLAVWKDTIIFPILALAGLFLWITVERISYISGECWWKMLDVVLMDLTHRWYTFINIGAHTVDFVT